MYFFLMIVAGQARTTYIYIYIDILYQKTTMTHEYVIVEVSFETASEQLFF
jgi:hypothetical protein